MQKWSYIKLTYLASILISKCISWKGKIPPKKAVKLKPLTIMTAMYVRQLASSVPSLQSRSPSHLHFLCIHSPLRHCISLDEHFAGGVGWRPQRDGDSSDWSYRVVIDQQSFSSLVVSTVTAHSIPLVIWDVYMRPGKPTAAHNPFLIRGKAAFLTASTQTLKNWIDYSFAALKCSALLPTCLFIL